MRNLVIFLPILMIAAFPLIYLGAQLSDMAVSFIGIILLFIGMSGPIIKRIGLK